MVAFLRCPHRLWMLASLGGLMGCHGDEPTVSAPYLTELLVDGGFEVELEAWTAEGCTRSGGHERLRPRTGAWMLLGGDGDCRAVQELDLLTLGFSAAEIDAGQLGVNAAGWVADRLEHNAFDDQAFVRVRFLDADRRRISTLESLLGASPDWEQRILLAGVPPNTRTLAVEVGGLFRQGMLNDSVIDDVSLMLEHRPPAAARVTLEPMLQDFRTDQMQILWETDRADEPARIEWGPQGGELSASNSRITTVQVAPNQYLHRGTVNRMAPGERVSYRACVGAVCTALYAFQSAPGPGAPIRVGWLADNQDNYSNLFSVHLAHLQVRSPDLVIMAGDIVQRGSILSEWADLWWRPITESGLGPTVPVMIARGNHDREFEYAYAYAAMPENGAWYSFRYGDVFFVVLDSNYGVGVDARPYSQVIYLERALRTQAALSAAFRVVVFHAAPFNSIQTTVNPEASSWGWEDGRETLVPVFESNGVDLVVSGHYHTYQRGSQNGVHYAVIGGGGSALLGDKLGGPYQSMWAHIESSWHYAVMDVDGGTLRWSTFGADDSLIDTFSIEDTPSSAHGVQ